MLQRILILSALGLTLVLPFALRSPVEAPAQAQDSLVIVSPHNEAIRHELGRAFAQWYRVRTGRTIAIDWRTIGGASEITRFIESEYFSSFQNYWTKQLGREWSSEVQTAFASERFDEAAASEEARAARAAFLDSEVGCGIDLFFGGGTYVFIRQAAAGRLVPTRVFQTHPQWFSDEAIPQQFAGEAYWDNEGRWVGVVFGDYGILYNKDALARLGVAQPPQQWADLCDPRFIGEMALCDPTKSGSIAKAFENIIQQQMQQSLQRVQRESPGLPRAELEARAVRAGWEAGLRIIQLMGANARYFTDSAQKPPIDVAQGDSAVGICIDFYGRYQAEATLRRDNTERLAYLSPRGGSVNSADPIGLLRGAPHREAAELFIEFVLSLEGQKLWNFKVGSEGGPQRFALRRIPIRRDFYARTDWQALRSDPEAQPYAQAEPLEYRAEWTGPLFREMAFVIRLMCLDTHRELVAAWRAIIAAGQPEAAMAALQDMSLLSYERTAGEIRHALRSKNRIDELHFARELGAQLRQQYARAAALAAAPR